MATDGSTPRVVVVGAGFGGVWAARTLSGCDVDVVLIDRNNYHTFFPLLYQVAAAELVPTDIAHPVRSLFRRSPNIEVRMAEMTGLDIEARRVLTDRGPVQYDRLILGLGSVPHYFGVDGASEHAFPLRWMDDAIPLRHHVLTRFEAAAHTEEPRARQRLLTFTVVGGGPTGVEYAGALSELIHGPLLRDFPRIRGEEVRVVLLEAADRLLGGMPAKLGSYAGGRLTRRFVTVRLGVRVEHVGPQSLELSSGEILPTETVVWTAGVRGDPAAAEWGLPAESGGRVPVTEYLHVAAHPEVFVVGDLAYREDAAGAPLPQVAQVAIQQGRRAAQNVLLSLAGADLKRFVYRDLGMLAVIGRNAAVAHVFGKTFRGFTAWFLWLTIHIAWLVGFRNRVLVLVNWAWNYVFYKRAVRLIIPGAMGTEHDVKHP